MNLAGELSRRMIEGGSKLLRPPKSMIRINPEEG